MIFFLPENGTRHHKTDFLLLCLSCIHRTHYLSARDDQNAIAECQKHIQVLAYEDNGHAVFLLLGEKIVNGIRGVNIKIITPGIADKKLVKLMTKSSYAYLVSAGVEIYEYTPGFIHEKTVICDDKYLTVGTINLDYRSFAHHYENGVWIFASEVVKDAKNEFMKTLSKSEKITEKAARLGFNERVIRNILRIFAPLM